MAQAEPFEHRFDGLAALTQVADPVLVAIDKGQKHAGRMRRVARFIVDQVAALMLVTIVGICVMYAKLSSGGEPPSLDKGAA